MNTHHIENIDKALDGVEEMVAKLRALADTGTKMGDELTQGMFLNNMTREEQFNAAMTLWRQFSKVGTALTWLELHARTARRNTNSLLEDVSEDA